MRYVQAYDGEWIRPWQYQAYYLRCCDCGLAHRVEFRVRKGRVEFRAFRLRRRSRRPRACK